MLFVWTCAYADEVVSTTAYTTSADVTISNLNDNRLTFTNFLNSIDGGNIQTGTVSADALRGTANSEQFRGEAFNDWVYTGLLPTAEAGGDLTSDITAGTVYVANTSTNRQPRVLKDATSHTYTAYKWTYVDINNNGTFTFVEQAQGTAEPNVTANSIRLARVSSDGDTLVVRDDRVTSISFGAGNEDFQMDRDWETSFNSKTS